MGKMVRDMWVIWLGICGYGEGYVGNMVRDMWVKG